MATAYLLPITNYGHPFLALVVVCCCYCCCCCCCYTMFVVCTDLCHTLCCKIQTFAPYCCFVLLQDCWSYRLSFSSVCDVNSVSILALMMMTQLHLHCSSMHLRFHRQILESDRSSHILLLMLGCMVAIRYFVVRCFVIMLATSDDA